MLTGVDVASRYKVAGALRTKKASEVAFVLKGCTMSAMFKYSKIFQSNNMLDFKRSGTKLLEKHNAIIRRVTTKYKQTHTVFLEAFNKGLEKRCLSLWRLKNFTTLKKIWDLISNLNSIINKMNNTKLPMIDIKPKETFKLDIVELDQCKTYSEEELLPEDGLCRYLYEPGEKQEDQKSYWIYLE